VTSRLSLSLSVLLLATAGCASSYRQLDGPLHLYEQGDLEGAADLLMSEQYDDDRDGDRHGVLWLLETGKVLHDVGRFEESEEAFERANGRIRVKDQSPSISISEELTSLLTTQQMREFHARHWQKILLETYRSMNQLALGDLSEALVFARRSYARQADAVFEHGEEIEKRDEGTAERDVDQDEVLSQGEVQGLLAPIQTRITPAYADYANPFTSYLAAILQWADDDRTRASVDLRKTLGMVPDNEYVQRLVVELEDAQPLASPTGRVYVIFENGMAPERVETGIGIVTRNGYSSIRLPTLSYHDSPVAALEIHGAAGEPSLRTAELADVDAMVSVDFADELPGIIIRTVLSIVTKEVATKQMRDKDQGWGFAIGTLWKALTEGADLRTWRSVGSRFEIAHFDRPADGIITLNLIDRNGGTHLPAELQLPRTTLTFLLCRSVNLASLRYHIVPAGDELPDAAPPEPGPEAAPAAEPEESPVEVPHADASGTVSPPEAVTADAATEEEQQP